MDRIGDGMIDPTSDLKLASTELCAWLNGLERRTHHDARPVKVLIGRQKYPGAVYTDDVGERVMYLLGALPASYKRLALYQMLIIGERKDNRLWYVRGYFPGRNGDLNDPRYASYHPFGRMLTIRRSNVPAFIDRSDPREVSTHRWLTHGGRGGLRPVMEITVYKQDKAGDLIPSGAQA